MPDSSPIFILSSFRTSSTWLWSKFRSAPTTLSYYEIFNEFLSICRISDFKVSNHRAWDSRHPVVAPYFLEFLPFMREDEPGIPEYDTSMSYGSFIPQGGVDGELLPAETAYVSKLIRQAQDLRKIPVLSCTRTLARAHALKKHFGGRTIFCYRNLFHQWGSYCGQAAIGNPFFLKTIEFTLKGSRRDPFLATIDDITKERMLSPHDESLFQAFLLLHLYLSVQAYEASDIVLDVTALPGNPAMQQAMGTTLSGLVGAPIDLSDVKNSFELSPLCVRDIDEFTDMLLQFTKLIRAQCRTQAGALFLEKMSNEALREWHRHEFYVQRSRHLANEETALLTQRISELQAELDDIRARLTTGQDCAPKAEGPLKAV